jgi:hypothetical protein
MNDELSDKLENDFKAMSAAFEALSLDRDQLYAAAEKLAEALEFECGNRCAEGLNPCNAREALAEYCEKFPKVEK